jgi:hypothetical protein
VLLRCLLRANMSAPRLKCALAEADAKTGGVTYLCPETACISPWRLISVGDVLPLHGLLCV